MLFDGEIAKTRSPWPFVPRIAMEWIGIETVLAGEILDDADEPVHPAVAAGVAGRADDHRHAESAGRQQHVLEIVPLPLQRA